jgi:hypothetical protein
MNGPIKKQSIGLGLGVLEVVTTFAGLLVVIGLIVESGPELWQAVITRVWPARTVVGGTVITVGVFAEVAVGIFIARRAKAAELEASVAIADAAERAANAEQAAAEANLARVRLERWISRRDISDDERNAIAAKLSNFAGQRIVIAAFPVAHEPIVFASLISATLSQAGWKVDLLPPQSSTSPPDGVMCTGFSLMSTPDEKSLKAGFALALELGPLSGGGIGPIPALQNPEDPRLQLVVHERDAPPKTWEQAE